MEALRVFSHLFMGALYLAALYGIINTFGWMGLIVYVLLSIAAAVIDIIVRDDLLRDDEEAARDY